MRNLRRTIGLLMTIGGGYVAIAVPSVVVLELFGLPSMLFLIYLSIAFFFLAEDILWSNALYFVPPFLLRFKLRHRRLDAFLMAAGWVPYAAAAWLAVWALLSSGEPA
ncbi:hypothetical protein FACS1894186_6040 [Alphaproteobacteria bacterium]|nr:hypothetical protein FACS1894186_6040 [Alphaproteobacteria bacterium]